jgi:hypothetical protein
MVIASTSRNEYMNDEKVQLLATIREIYGRVVWSHKTHEKQRELRSARANFDSWINVLLTATTTLIVIISFPLDDPWADVIATIFAGITTLFAVYRLSFSPEGEAQNHRQAAKALLIERDRLLLLIEQCMAADDNELDEIRRELKKATERVGQIYATAPDTTPKAYHMAGEALHMNEEFTFSSQEIDLLLPPQLRLGQEQATKHT